MAGIQTSMKHQRFCTNLCSSTINFSHTSWYGTKSTPFLESPGRSWQSILRHIPCHRIWFYNTFIIIIINNFLSSVH